MYDNYFDDTRPLMPYTRSVPADSRSSVPATNAVREKQAPEFKEGHHPCWDGKKWRQVEDHRGRQGYIVGVPTVIAEVGPLPEDWSDTPPAPTLEEARAAKLAEVMSAYQAAFAPVEAVYPAAEREGWPVQEAEARAVLADPKAETPVLSLLVQLRDRNEMVTELAQKVLANAGQWRMLYAYLTGQQQRMYAEVSALETVEALQAYRVEYQMPG